MAKKRDTEFALIIRELGGPQQVLLKYVVMILNYRYGLDISVEDTMKEGVVSLRSNASKVRAIFIIQNDHISSRMGLQAFTLQGKIPLIVLCPNALMGLQMRTARKVPKVSILAWEKAFGKSGPGLALVIEEAFKEVDVGGLTDGDPAPEEMQKRVEVRLRNLRSLPAMPEIILRIMKMVADPSSTAENLEGLLLSDPAIVEKLLQVINSPVFAGVGKTGQWTLKEAIVRMGLKKVGAIAQQVKLMNTFAQQEDSEFDLRRFWEHSVGCAVLADKIMTDKSAPIKEAIEFDDYWIGALIHDIGKLILGQFFWDHFENVLNQMHTEETPIAFREAERQLLDAVNHEYLGKLMLMKSNMKEELVEVVSEHHTIAATSSKLVALTNLVDNMSKELNIGYVPGEPAVYTPEMLSALGIDQGTVDKLKESLGNTVTAEIQEMVGKCL